MSKPNPANKENLPLPPSAKPAKKAAKTFLAKLIERTARAIKQANEIEARTALMIEKAPELAKNVREAVESVRGASVDAKASLHETLEELTSLQDLGYAFTGKGGAQRAPLAIGKQVWLRHGVWVRKYAPVYQPEELDGLEVVAVVGKVVRAKTASGLQITEPVGSFTTQATSYEVSAA